MSGEEIINRVTNSGLITIDLEDLYHPGERVELDIKEQLFQGMALRENDFREYISNTDWSLYKDQNVAISCSLDAIIPTWAYMLLTSSLEPFTNKVVFGSLQNLEQALYQGEIEKIDLEELKDQRIVIKGCSNKPVPTFAYTALTEKLRPIARSIMYGEPCSTVPIFKKPRK